MPSPVRPGEDRPCDIHATANVHVLNGIWIDAQGLLYIVPYRNNFRIALLGAEEYRVNAITFGRWFSERRRQRGWSSQLAFVEAARREPLLAEYRISEDFLARLEAGRLAYPFRGGVRRRVLALTVLLCKTPRDMSSYLRSARLNQLSADEAEYLNYLARRLETRSPSSVSILPPRPARLIGRASLVDELVTMLCAGEAGLCSVTGMPGVGKSALAFEAVHQLAAHVRERQHNFPDGIATFTCTGRQGTDGLVSLLNEISEVFSASPLPASPDLASIIDRARIALAGKRTLLILDGLDAQFPLRQALEALLARDPGDPTRRTGGMQAKAHKRPSHVVLTTSRYVPSPALAAYHLHIDPLKPGAALELLASLLGRPLQYQEHAYAEQVCAAVGYLPLALEVAAGAIRTKGIPLSLLAACVTANPLDSALDAEREISSSLLQELEAFEPEMQKRFALLATLGVRSFGLETAAAIDSSHYAVPSAQLANTASDLGRFVRHSLVELAHGNTPAHSPTPGLYTPGNDTRYQLHPLLHAQAMERLERLEPEVVRAARCNVQSYALAYLQRYQGERIKLANERDFLLAALTQAWCEKQYPLVARFVSGLLPLLGQLGSFSERMLLWGLDACQSIHDRQLMAVFLQCLGSLYSTRGQLVSARCMFEESLALAKLLGQPVYLWQPLANLAYIAYLSGEYDATRRFAETYLQHCQEAGDYDFISGALLTCASYARLQGDVDAAYNYVNSCLHLLTIPDTDASFYGRDIVELRARTELARVQGDYACSREYNEKALSLALPSYGPYFTADELLIQAYFARQQGVYDDARTLALRSVQFAEQAGASHTRGLAMDLLQKLPGSLLPQF